MNVQYCVGSISTMMYNCWMHCDGSSSGKHVYLRIILVVRLGFPIVLTTLFCTFGR